MSARFGSRGDLHVLAIPLHADFADEDPVCYCAVNPGFGGQKFIPSQVQKIKKLREMCKERGVDPWIEVDGGVSGANAYQVIISPTPPLPLTCPVCKSAAPDLPTESSKFHRFPKWGCCFWACHLPLQ